VKRAKVQSLGSLREQMKAVARGEYPAPPDEGKPSLNSVEAVRTPVDVSWSSTVQRVADERHN